MRELAGNGGSQRDALVGRAEQLVVGNAGGIDGVRIAVAQLGQGQAGVKTAGIEEIRAYPAGLEGELAKTQRVGIQRQLQETGTVVTNVNTLSYRLLRLLG